jgi:hypothetical protein
MLHVYVPPGFESEAFATASSALAAAANARFASELEGNTFRSSRLPPSNMLGEGVVSERGSKSMGGTMLVYGAHHRRARQPCEKVPGYSLVWPDRYAATSGTLNTSAIAAINTHALALGALEAELMPEAAAARLALANEIDLDARFRVVEGDASCSGLAVTLSQSYIVSPHDDSGAMPETVSFTWPSEHPLPSGHEWAFAVAGCIHPLPTTPSEMAFCSMRGGGVFHGTLPTSSTLPHIASHPGVASALVTKSNLVDLLRTGEKAEAPWPTREQLRRQRQRDDTSDDESSGEAANSCAICHDELTTPATGDACAHPACLQCLHEWVVLRGKHSCPACRTPINALCIVGSEARIPVRSTAVAAESESEAAEEAEEAEEAESESAEAAEAALVANSSSYSPLWVPVIQRDALLMFCRDCPFQLYQMARARQTRNTWRYKAPKAEYYILDENGRRPVYYWGQAPEFYQAGQPMPPLLESIANRLNAEYGLTGTDRLNSCLVICNDDPSVHEAPPHRDKHRTSRFFDISLGYPLSIVFSDGEGGEVARQELEPFSLLAVSAADNHQYKHAVPPNTAQPVNSPRFSIVFRAITEHPAGHAQGEHFAQVDQAAAARVSPGGDLWRPYVPHVLRQEETEEAEAAEAAEAEAAEAEAAEAEESDGEVEGAEAETEEAEAAGEMEAVEAAMQEAAGGIASLAELDAAIPADTATDPPAPSARSLARSGRLETMLLLDGVLSAIRDAPPTAPPDMLALDSLPEALANATRAKARRALGMEELPQDAIFTSNPYGDDGWMATACEVPAAKRPTIASALSKLAKVAASRLAQDGGECAELKVSWRDGVRCRNTNVVVWTGNALAVRQELAAGHDAASVSAIRYCRHCNQLAITFCGCPSPPLPPLPPLPDES